MSSNVTHNTFKPTEGWVGMDSLDAPPSSCVVGSKNIWLESNAIIPREGMISLGTSTAPGATDDVIGLVAFAPSIENLFPQQAWLVSQSYSGRTFMIFSPTAGDSNDSEAWGSWKSLTPVSAAGRTLSFSAAGGNRAFSDVIFLDRIGESVALVGRSQAGWSLGVVQSNTTALSYLTGSPQVVGDVCVFDNSPIVWGIRDDSTATIYETRVQWPVGSDAEDWTGIGSGAEDLVDITGTATRIFTVGDQLILATENEIWRGRKIGGSYRFQFSPLVRNLGIPYASAAVSTPHGIFWLGSDYMVYKLVGAQITPVGQPILQELRDTLWPEDTTYKYNNLFMAYDPRQEAVTLHYSATPTKGADRGFTYHIYGNKWTPQRYGTRLCCSTFADIGHGTERSNLSSTQQGPKEVIYGAANGSVLVHSFVSGLDDGQDREAVYISGGVFTGDNENMKLMTEIKMDARTDSTSNMSVHGSGNLGGAFATDSQFAVSVQSNTSQTRVFPKVSGQYHQVKVTSEDTGWRLMRIGVKAQTTGKAL